MHVSALNTFAVALAATASVNGHVVLETPRPFKFLEYGPTNPLDPDGSNFPCKKREGQTLEVDGERTRMVTGEEHKIIDPYSRLSSVTIEMLSFQAHYDVAVVDEIQMIADDQRGCAWTNAVLGLAAKELHLCGEDTAIPLVQELIAHTGDELVINRCV